MYRNAIISTAAALAISFSGLAQVDLKPTTKFFMVDNFYALDSKGEPSLYRASGFYEPGSPSTKPSIFILPQITVDKEKIKFYSNGKQVTLNSSTMSTVNSIEITLKYSASLPSESQSVGIAVQTGGKPQSTYYQKSVKNVQGTPLVVPMLNPYSIGAEMIRKAYRRHDSLLTIQQGNLSRWQNYYAEATGINELAIKLVVNGDVISESFIPGSTSGSLPNLAVKNPTLDVAQRLRDGNFEIHVNYRFRDANVGLVDASFDVEEILTSYVKETQKAITSNKSSGMQLFGIGSRRNKVKQKMEQNLVTKQNISKRAGTVIVMSDADDSQVERFEDTFFPSLSKDNAINNHLEASKQATAAGKVDLAKAHLEYANALQKGVELEEVDAVGAAAALGAGDYATFLAKGVRFMDAATKTSGSFIRVATDKIQTDVSKQWTDVKKRSIQRAITLVVRPEEASTYPADLGIITSWFKPIPNLLSGFMITCLTENSPLVKAGVVNDEIIRKIDGKEIRTFDEYESTLLDYSPEDIVNIEFIDFNRNTLVRQIRLGKGLPR